jgi:putative transposase
MPRLARLVVPGHPHHITQRGNRCQRTFFSDADYRRYIRYLADACESTGTAVWAWCLMPNHAHLILVPAADMGLARAMAETHRRYSRSINVREGWSGHLWQSRFASFVMDEPYLLACARYVELNPVRAGLAERPDQWAWSSARAHLGGSGDGLVDPKPLLDRWPDWRAVVGAALDEELRQAIRARERNGHPLGDEAFIAAVAGHTTRPLTPRRRGPKPRRLWES